MKNFHSQKRNLWTVNRSKQVRQPYLLILERKKHIYLVFFHDKGVSLVRVCATRVILSHMNFYIIRTNIPVLGQRAAPGPLRSYPKKFAEHMLGAADVGGKQGSR